MTELKQAYESLGFENVSTYIQSGNIVFSTKLKNAEKLSLTIENMIQQEFAYQVSNVLRSKAEMESIYHSNPFLKQKTVDISKLHVTFMQKTPDAAQIKKLTDTIDKNDEIIIHGKEIYLHCPDGYGKTKFSNTYLENKLKTPMTTRNWKTIGKLVEITNS